MVFFQYKTATSWLKRTAAPTTDHVQPWNGSREVAMEEDTFSNTTFAMTVEQLSLHSMKQRNGVEQ